MNSGAIQKFCSAFVVNLSKRYKSVDLKMNVFTQKRNPITGASEWDMQHENYDYHQEIARSSFADMLHDTERNKMYYRALQLAIDKMHDAGKMANVLDIGTGTGLLSIMAARCGADSIVACEAFKPMADCCLKILQQNRVADKITVIPKRSTELTVGDDGDMKQRANILVTEVFDTELIGEGALSTFSHAHKHLLEKDCIVVPDSAVIYAQVVECPTMQRWNKLEDIKDEILGVHLETPQKMKDCAGSAAVHDLQLSQLSRRTFAELSEPLPVFYYDWSGRSPLDFKRTIKQTFTACANGNAQMVFMWWELNMDCEGKIVLSCAPWWNHLAARISADYPQDTIPWRDHWMQAIYYLPKQCSVKLDTDYTLICCQDEYSIWFYLENQKSNPQNDSIAQSEPQTDSVAQSKPQTDSVAQSESQTDSVAQSETQTDSVAQNKSQTDYPRPICECGVHMALSRTHVAYLNNEERTMMFLKEIKKQMKEIMNPVVLDLNGSSLLGLASAKIGAKTVYILESMSLNLRILEEYISANNLKNVEIIPEITDEIISKVNLVVCDPNFSSAILPWENLKMAHLLLTVKEKLRCDVAIVPEKCEFYAMPVEFLDLHKIRIPLGKCEGIDMKAFDDLVESSRTISDSELEAQPLWEYPSYCRGTPRKLLEVDMLALNHTYAANEPHSLAKPQDGDQIVNGFAVWTEWSIGDKRHSTGPIGTPRVGDRLQWDPHTRQAVKILKNTYQMKSTDKWSYQLACDLSTGLFNLNLDLLSKNKPLSTFCASTRRSSKTHE